MGARRTRTERMADRAWLLFRAALFVFLLSLGYLCWVTFSGVLQTFPQGFDRASSELAARNVTFVGWAFAISALVLALTSAGLWLGAPWLPLVMGLVGAAVFLLLRTLALPLLSEPSRDALRPQHPGAAILDALGAGGMALLVVAGVLLAHLAWEEMRNSLTRRRRTAGGVKLPFYSACWQTHHCKEALRNFCRTGREGFRKSCWRYKCGCFCDASMADQMLALATKKKGAPLPGLGRPARAPRMTFWDHFIGTRTKIPGQTIACGDCPIYTYHELQKHRILAPLVVLSVPVAMYLFSDRLHHVWLGFVGGIERWVANIAFTPRNTALVAEQVRGALGADAIEWMLAVVLTLWLMTLAARILEWWCFEARL